MYGKYCIVDLLCDPSQNDSSVKENKNAFTFTNISDKKRGKVFFFFFIKI